MKAISVEESKKIQLDILQSVHDFCKRSNISYSISGGTLIGAIRHRGFIPWDDDIDIALTRAEYEKFISSYKDETGIYKLHCLENDPNYCYPYAKVEDTRTFLDEDVAGPKMGIAIDIFPVEDMLHSREESEKLMKRMINYQMLYKAKLIKPSVRNSFAKRCGIYILKMLLFPVSLRYLAQKLSEKAKQYGKPSSTFIGCSVSGYGIKEIIHRWVFDEFVELPFEDRSFSAFSHYHEYLKSLYGDYMQLPPEDKRHSPHTLKGIYWKDHGFFT